MPQCYAQIVTFPLPVDLDKAHPYKWKGNLQIGNKLKKQTKKNNISDT